MNKILEIVNASTGYNHKPILENLNFTVRENDFIGVIGPNGGGKTTLLKLILGLIQPFSGKVNFYANGRSKRSLIGYLPQENKFDKQFPISVLEVVLSGLMSDKGIFGRYSKKDKQLALSFLERTGMASYANHPIGELSGGQQQKVFLSRAVVSSPKLLILDEPSTYVDNQFEGKLYEILNELNKEMAIILVSHDLGTISRYVKSIACVNRTLHYHPSNKISQKQLTEYKCPLQIITHGDIPHTVLKNH